MTNITEEQLISQIKTLKAIKPNEKWASLLLQEIVSEKEVAQNAPATFTGYPTSVWSVFTQQKFAYSLALFAFVVVGSLSFVQYTIPGDLLFPVKKLAEQSQLNLSGQTLVAQNITTFNNRVSDLALVAKSGKKQSVPSVLGEIQANASQLTKALKDSSADKTELKEIALTLKTLASVSGSDVTEDENVKSLYETVVITQIKDLEQSTLTEAQAELLEKAKDLHQKGKYTEALEILLEIQN